MAAKKQLGQVLIEKGLANEGQIKEALRMQAGGKRRLGYILVRMGVLTNDQLLNVLEEHAGVEVADIDKTIKPEVKSLMPRYLCTRYSVIPLSFEGSNVVRLAMLDPSDDEAIRDIEQYLDKAVKPYLAHEEKIKTGIIKHIPYSMKDLFNSPLSGKVMRAVAVLLLVGIGFSGYYSYNAYNLEKFGEITVSGPLTTYKNHDLMLGVEEKSISLTGHAAYADGLYKVAFSNTQDLKAFLERKRSSFSEKQYEWLTWAIDTDIPARKR
ncbi:MAG: hypothetical protein ACOY4H_01075 [Thermodesulfobacteriota bacterium]